MGDDVFFDRILPAGGLALVSLVILLLTVRVTRIWSRRQLAILGAGAIAAIAAFAFSYSIHLARPNLRA